MSIPIQGTLDATGLPLVSTTFVVVDLETTGGSPGSAQITEFGAVKVCGGEVIGEFSSLVRPPGPIPPFISVLTGITDAMVATAPRIDAVLPAFLEFARDSVLVAHNAPFDIGFLQAACAGLDTPWPAFQVLDTARLARRVVSRDEARNCKLATLARLFGSGTVPNHRALYDARATVDVLHGILERLGNVGVHTVEELALWQSTVTAAQRSKRHLAERLPHAPGVYIFADGSGEALYVGKSKDLRNRVRTYFTASETRQRMTEMVALAATVTGIQCATALEAEVRELRLIAARKPRYNRRSRFPERGSWLKLTVEPFPRLSMVRQVRADGAAYLGPFGSRRLAESAMAAVYEALPIRQCTKRLSPSRPTSACILAEMGRCGAPCTGAETVEQYARHADLVRQAFTGDPGPIVSRLLDRIQRLAEQQRYEDATAHRDRLSTFLRVAARCQRIAHLAAVPQLIAAQRRANGEWELHVIRHARLVAADVAPVGTDPRSRLDALVATAETVTAPVPPLPAATTEEAECVLRWLEAPGTRLVDIDGCWACTAPGAGAYLDVVSATQSDREAARPLQDHRYLRPVG